jgi:hypothetical protein
MKKNILFLKISLLSLAYFLIANPSFAQTTAPTTRIQTVTLNNPLKTVNTIDGLLVAILNIVMVLMVPVVVFFIIMAGFKYVTAQGNSTKVEEATRALTYAVIGGVLILGAVAISQIIQSTVNAF